MIEISYTSDVIDDNEIQIGRVIKKETKDKAQDNTRGTENFSISKEKE